MKELFIQAIRGVNLPYTVIIGAMAAYWLVEYFRGSDVGLFYCT